jgi:hypothetical protein
MHLYEFVVLKSCILQKLVTWVLKNKKLYDFNKFTSDALVSELYYHYYSVGSFIIVILYI